MPMKREGSGAYLVKPPLDGTDADGKIKQYHPSRNLVRPQPEKKKYHRWTVRKLIEEGPKPTPGFYIVPDSVVSGVNPYTGMSYLHYEEERLKKRRNGTDECEKCHAQ